MQGLALHEFHRGLGARFTELNGAAAVGDYGDALAEYKAFHESAGLIDLSFRSRLCVTGADRVRFLHGQVTNDIKSLQPGQGCYAALITAKGRMQSDLNVYVLEDELLLDFEPGLAAAVAQRLEKYVIADDVQIVDVAADYGLLSVQGSQATQVVTAFAHSVQVPSKPFAWVKMAYPESPDIYLINQPRLGTHGFDLFVPVSAIGDAAARLLDAVKAVGGRACGWQALDMVRIEAGIPRFGMDMDESNIPLEAGLEKRAISFAKGCYIGQEVISRIKTYSEVAKALRGLRFEAGAGIIPAKGDKLFHDEKEVGYVTSAVESPRLKAMIGLGYVRRETNQVGTELRVRVGERESAAKIVEVPFK